MTIRWYVCLKGVGLSKYLRHPSAYFKAGPGVVCTPFFNGMPGGSGVLAAKFSICVFSFHVLRARCSDFRSGTTLTSNAWNEELQTPERLIRATPPQLMETQFTT